MYRSLVIATAALLITAGQALAQSSRDPFTGANANLCGSICSGLNGVTLYRFGPDQSYRYSPPSEQPRYDAPTFSGNWQEMGSRKAWDNGGRNPWDSSTWSQPGSNEAIWWAASATLVELT